ncbi:MULTISPECIES: Gmad2 immunoglobulin-like domain-containing protein [unclassified Knoellia]|uniref:Gmad2 immunoglobulin-like domain-containing protein n=1 Tax=Knoellia altitudinis TaxID=3404795 RepID=UPI0036150508
MTTQLDPSDTERVLREVLAARARGIRPADRLDEILREASEPAPSPVRSRWVTGLGVAAAAAAVAGVVWAAGPAPERLPGQPVGPPSVTSPTLPAPSLSPSTASTPPTSAGAALAIYRVGTNGGTDNRPGLVREFWTSGVGVSASESARVSAAVGESLRRSELWQGVTLDRALVSDDVITLRLSASGDRAPDAERARLAISSLVWTAQGAVGRGDVPVSIRPASGGELLGHLESSTRFTRAATPPEALCDIWVDDPSPGATLPLARAVSVRGQAVAFEANVEWELRRGTTTVRDGFVTASMGAPARGTFTIDLGRLEAGTWTIRTFVSSAEDGQQAVAERLVTFTVG